MRITALTCLVVLFLSAWVRADDIVLVDGRYLQVKVLGVTEKKLHVKLLDTGGELWIPWDLIREADRDRLMIAHGLKEAERPEIVRPGVRLVTRTGEEFFGIPTTKFDAQSVPDEVVIIHKGREWPFKKSVIRTLEWRDIPALEAYTQEQLYEQELARIKPGEEDLEGHWDLARFAQEIELYGRAVEHMLKVREIDPLYRSDYVGNQLDRMEVLARNQKIVDAIRGAKRQSYVKRFDQAIEQIDQIITLEEVDPNIKATAELTKEGILKRRWTYFSKQVTRGYFNLLDNKIGKMARDSKMELKTAQNELRREMHKEIVADLAAKYGLDPKKEVEKMWEERVVHQPRRASYGSGTFIVLGKAKGAENRMQQFQRQMARQQQQQRRRNGGRGQQQQPNNTIRPPKPPTKEDWWKKIASSGMRAQWMKAFYAENGKKLEVVGERKDACTRCGGTGTMKLAGSQGETITFTCPRCQGHRYDKGVAYK